MPILRNMIKRLWHHQSIRAETLSLFLEHGPDASTIALCLASGPSAPADQRWFYTQVHRGVDNLASHMRQLDISTRYLAYNQLEADYLRLGERRMTGYANNPGRLRHSAKRIGR